jgi:hypothetical protein
MISPCIESYGIRSSWDQREEFFSELVFWEKVKSIIHDFCMHIKAYLGRKTPSLTGRVKQEAVTATSMFSPKGVLVHPERKVPTKEEQIVSVLNAFYSSEVKKLLSDLWSCVLSGEEISAQIRSNGILEVQCKVQPEITGMLNIISPILSTHGIIIQEKDDHQVSVKISIPEELRSAVTNILGLTDCTVALNQENFSVDFGGAYKASIKDEAVQQLIQSSLIPGLKSDGKVDCKVATIDLKGACIQMPGKLKGQISIGKNSFSINFGEEDKIVATVPYKLMRIGGTMKAAIRSIGVEGNQAVVKIRLPDEGRFSILKNGIQWIARMLRKVEIETDRYGKKILVMKVDLSEKPPQIVQDLQAWILNLLCKGGQLLERIQEKKEAHEDVVQANVSQQAFSATTTEEQIVSVVDAIYSPQMKGLLSKLWSCVLGGEKLFISINSDEKLVVQGEVTSGLKALIQAINPILSAHGITIQEKGGNQVSVALSIPQEFCSMIQAVIGSGNCDVMLDKEKKEFSLHFGGQVQELLSAFWNSLIVGSQIMLQIDDKGKMLIGFKAQDGLERLIRGLLPIFAGSSLVRVQEDNGYIFVEINAPSLAKEGRNICVALEKKEEGIALSVNPEQLLVFQKRDARGESTTTKEEQIVSVINSLYAPEVHGLLSNLWSCVLGEEELSAEINSDGKLEVQCSVKPALKGILQTISSSLSNYGIIIEMGDDGRVSIKIPLPQEFQPITTVFGSKNCKIALDKEEKEFSLHFGETYEAGITTEALKRLSQAKLPAKSGKTKHLIPGLDSKGCINFKVVKIDLQDARIQLPKQVRGQISATQKTLVVNFGESNALAAIIPYRVVGKRGTMKAAIRSIGLEGEQAVVKIRLPDEGQSKVVKGAIQAAATMLGKTERDSQGKKILVVKVDLTKETTPAAEQMQALVQKLLREGQLLERMIA